MKRRKLRIPLVAILALLIFAAAPLPAQAKKQAFPAVVSYKGKLHVAGRLTFLVGYDTLSSCQPGQSFTVKMVSSAAVTKPVRVQVLSGKDVSTSGARKHGGARNVHTIQGYRESNYCPPDEPIVLEKPQCRSLSGNVAASIGRASLKGPGRVSIKIGRTSGGSQGLDCLPLNIWNPTPRGSQIEQLDNKYSGIVLPLGLRARSFLTLGVKKKLTRTIHIGGPCTGPVVSSRSHSSHVSALGASASVVLGDDDCTVDGTFKVVFARLTKKGRPPPLN